MRRSILTFDDHADAQLIGCLARITSQISLLQMRKHAVLGLARQVRALSIQWKSAPACQVFR